MKILSKIQNETNNIKNEVYNFAFTNPQINYESQLIGFNKNLYSLFDSYYESLNITKSIKSLFDGEIVNKSENRAALHHIYRDNFDTKINNNVSNEAIDIFQKNINKCINLKKTLLKKGIKNIVTIGIGGSFEGPKLLIETLTNVNKRNFKHIFLTGPDVDEFFETIELLDKNETFFIISSKSFTTDETLQTLKLSEEWLKPKYNFDDHFIAVTSQTDKAIEYGFKEQNIIYFPKEIGGRYSIWSPISLPAILELGENFKDFLTGGMLADNHLLNNQKYNEFIKLLSFSDIWYSNFLNKKTRVVLIYNWKMRFFSDYVQQLEMESLGKPANYLSPLKNTGQVIFGGFGPIAQHSYFQLLHQGTAELCADIIYIEDNNKKNGLLNAQFNAQSNLLVKNENKNFNSDNHVNSNIPSNLFTLKNLSPECIGYLIASWEHRTFISANMLQINPYDQFGVTAGKIFTKKHKKYHGG